MKCKFCGSERTQGRGHAQVQCKDCGKYTTARDEKGKPLPSVRICPRCGSSETHKSGESLYCKKCKHYSTLEGKAGESREVEYGDTYIRVISSSPRIRCEEDVIREFHIDLAKWRVDKVRVKTSEGYRKDRSVKWKVKDGKVLEGDVNDTGDMLVVPMYHMEVLFVRKTQEIRARAAIEEVLKEAKKEAAALGGGKRLGRVKQARAGKERGMLLEVDFPDLHFGKLTWEEESGENYDIKIAAETVESAVEALMGYAAGHRIERILLPLGNDFFNVDNKDNTTVHGTPQQEDTRWQKTFRTGRRLAVQIIEGLAEAAPVDVLIIPGNHDETRMFYLGDVLDVKYEGSARVRVDNHAMKRKYYVFGRTLLGLTHGYHEKYEKLSFIMATERAEDWARTQHREWHLGDKQ